MPIQMHILTNKTILIVSDNADRAHATKWLEFEITDTVHPLQSLFVSQAKILRVAHALVSAEIERIESILNPSPVGKS